MSLLNVIQNFVVFIQFFFGANHSRWTEIFMKTETSSLIIIFITNDIFVYHIKFNAHQKWRYKCFNWNMIFNFISKNKMLFLFWCLFFIHRTRKFKPYLPTHTHITSHISNFAFIKFHLKYVDFNKKIVGLWMSVWTRLMKMEAIILSLWLFFAFSENNYPYGGYL